MLSPVILNTLKIKILYTQGNQILVLKLGFFYNRGFVKLFHFINSFQLNRTDDGIAVNYLVSAANLVNHIRPGISHFAGG